MLIRIALETESTLPASVKADGALLDLNEISTATLDALSRVQSAEQVEETASWVSPPSAKSIAASRSKLIEPLTDRELEVLSLIAEGMQNRQMAAALFVTLSTVKTHINNIYRKLDVSNRVQALARARELELL